MPRNINYPGYQTGGITSVTRRQSRPIPFPKPDFLSDDARPIPFPEMDLSRFKLAGEGGGIEDDYEYGNITQLEELFLRGDINQEQFDTAMEDQRQGYDRLSSRNSARYTESLARALAEDAQRRASGGIIGLQQGGPAPQVSRVTSYGVPQQTARQWAGLTDRIVAEGQRPYQQYGGQRFAGFTQPEAAAMAGQVAYGQGMGPMGTRQAAQTLGQAGQMIGGAQQGLMSLQPQYAQMAGQFGVAAPLAQQQAQEAGQGMGQLGSRAILQGQLAGAGMRTTGGEALTAQEKFAVGLPSEEGAGGMVGMGTKAQAKTTAGAETMRGIGTLAKAPKMQTAANLKDYMSQYTAGVTDPQLQRLMEFQRMQGEELGSKAAQQGAYGGSRMGVERGKLAETTTQEASKIIGTGQQEAFESAQQAFQADRAAQAAGYGQQLTAEQQASAQEQQGFQAQMGAQRQAAQMSQAGAGMSQLGQQQGFQAAQAGTQLGLGALQAAQGARQQGWGTYGQMLGQQQGAIGAQGQLYSQMGGMGGQLAGVGGQQMQLGAQEQQQQFERLRGMEGAGEKQRAMMDRSLGMGYQDWQNQLNQERANIGWQGAAMSGLPYQGTVTESQYSPQVGPGASALATGVGALGLYNQYQQNQQNQRAGNQQQPAGGWAQPWLGQNAQPQQPAGGWAQQWLNPSQQNQQAGQQNQQAGQQPYNTTNTGTPADYGNQSGVDQANQAANGYQQFGWGG